MGGTLALCGVGVRRHARGAAARAPRGGAYGDVPYVVLSVTRWPPRIAL